MLYHEGNVIEKRGIVFKDTNTPDPRGKHPAMIAIAVSEDNQFMYYLTLTSQLRHYEIYREMYKLIRKTSENRLRKTSLVNLANIYKDAVSSHAPVAFIQPDEYRALIVKFKAYQERHPDEYYSEIKDLI